MVFANTVEICRFFCADDLSEVKAKLMQLLQAKGSLPIFLLGSLQNRLFDPLY